MITWGDYYTELMIMAIKNKNQKLISKKNKLNNYQIM
jgi:hypothetical protein